MASSTFAGPQGPSPRLDRLPRELIDRVLSHLYPHTLAVLARCSRILKSPAETYLYGHVDFPAIKTPAHGLICPAAETPNPRLRDFAYALAYRQRRLWTVQRLSVHFYLLEDGALWYEQEAIGGGEHYITPPQYERFLKTGFDEASAVARLDHSTSKDWLLNVLRCTNDDAVLGLMLPALRSLEILELTSVKYSIGYLEKIFEPETPKDPDDLMSPTGRLHTVIFHDVGKAMRYSQLFKVLLRFPSLRRLHWNKLESRNVHNESRPTDLPSQQKLSYLPRQSSRVERIELQNNTLSRADLHGLVRAPKVLHTFVIHSSQPHLMGGIIEYHACREALEQHQKTLETIWLGNMHCSCDTKYWSQRSSHKPIAGFASFTKLKRLGLTPNYIFGIDDAADRGEGVDLEPQSWNEHNCRRLRGFLPTNLEVLVISGAHCGSSKGRLLKALNDYAMDMPRSLRRIRLEGHFEHFDRDHWDEVDRFGVACQQWGVEFFLVHPPKHFWTLIPTGAGTCEAADAFDKRMWGAPSNDVKALTRDHAPHSPPTVLRSIVPTYGAKYAEDMGEPSTWV